MRRKGRIVEFTERVTDPVLRRVVDRLQDVLGRMVSFANVAMLLSTGGYTVTNAASGAGTALTFTRTSLDPADSGADQARVVVRGKNSGVGSVAVQIFDVTNGVAVCTVTVTDATEATFVGEWAALIATGTEQELEVRCVGDGAFDPILYAVHLQMRTLSARS